MTKPLQTYILPDNLESEINGLQQYVARFKSGEISLTEFKVHRVPFGVYEQRKKDTYMVRVRCAGAVVTPNQLEKVAEISKAYATEYIHLTTRQEIQLHYVLIENIIPVIRELKTVGLSTRGGGGNTVRNIMAQEDAGIAIDEAFDVTPYAIALTSRMSAEPDSWNLPRKFKFAFSGSPNDRGYATISDVGFIAQIKDGQKGFKVYMAGGLGAKPQVACPVHDFIPESEVYNVAKAAKNLFYKNGNRKNKHAARLRFVLKNLGEEEFKKKYFEELESVRKENYPSLDAQEIDNSGVDPDLPVETVKERADFELWKTRFLQKQSQEGFCAIILPVHLGHVDNDQTIALARFLKPFGDNTIRIRKDQNFFLRGIPTKNLPNLYNFLKATFANFNQPFIIDKIIACAGASTCQLGICLSPGAATATRQSLEHADFNLDAANDARINISGCPNSCGQHHIAHLGFFGKVARKGDKVFPAYNVIMGAKVYDGKTELARKVGEVAARDIPKLINAVLKQYVAKKDKYATFEEYTRSEEGRTDVAVICDTLKIAGDAQVAEDYFFDWGEDKVFSIAERGKGECSASIFDLIESDLGNIRRTKKLFDDLQEKSGSEEQKCQLLKDTILYSSRVLLVSRALEPKSEQEVYNYFREYFINTGFVDASFDELLKIAESGNYDALTGKKDRVYALADRMQLLYDVMDPAFNFKLEEGNQGQTPTQAIETTTVEKTQSSVPKADVVKDFRGVGCPMNFVKTKMELSKMQSHQVLEILLDDGPPIENVPGSVREEGHKVLQQKKVDNHWLVLIEKQ